MLSICLFGGRLILCPVNYILIEATKMYALDTDSLIFRTLKTPLAYEQITRIKLDIDITENTECKM